MSLMRHYMQIQRLLNRHTLDWFPRYVYYRENYFSPAVEADVKQAYIKQVSKIRTLSVQLTSPQQQGQIHTLHIR